MRHVTTDGQWYRGHSLVSALGRHGMGEATHHTNLLAASQPQRAAHQRYCGSFQCLAASQTEGLGWGGVQLGTAESDVPGHSPLIPTATLAQALQAWKPESHPPAPAPSQARGGWNGASAWLSLVPSPQWRTWH